MKPVTQLVRIKHGSHLYGTSTPSSDQDFKGVHLPSGRNIILGRAEDVIQSGVTAKIEGTDKNSADAIDSDSYSLQKFFDMLMKGDTVATEILFAPTPLFPRYEGLQVSGAWSQVQQVGMQLLNRQCKGFVGYCVRQAAKYGIKGSRMNAVKKLLDFLEDECRSGSTVMKLGDFEAQLRALSEGQEHMSWENIPHPDGRDCWHIVCCDRKMPMSATVSGARDVYDKVWTNYGERARAAATNEGIDWKAMSHAVRVAGQAIELLDTGKITFPRPNAEFLLKVKLGVFDYDEVSAILERRVQQVHEASERSSLPETSNRALADQLVLAMYEEQING